MLRLLYINRTHSIFGIRIVSLRHSSHSKFTITPWSGRQLTQRWRHGLGHAFSARERKCHNTQEAPWDKLFLPAQGFNTFILTWWDLFLLRKDTASHAGTKFSKWPEAIPMVDISIDKVASALYHGCISNFGFPFSVTIDQGTQFESSLFKA